MLTNRVPLFVLQIQAQNGIPNVSVSTVYTSEVFWNFHKQRIFTPLTQKQRSLSKVFKLSLSWFTANFKARWKAGDSVRRLRLKVICYLPLNTWNPDSTRRSTCLGWPTLPESIFSDGKQELWASHSTETAFASLLKSPSWSGGEVWQQRMVL